MYYIYCYINNINGKKYVGQTNNLLRRKLEHKSAAFNKNSPEYNLLFHQKLRQYGLENFTIEVLEQGENNKDYIDEREIFWIKEKQSFVKENGYNLTTGGQNRNNKSCLENSKINRNILIEIIDKIKNSSLTLTDIAKEYNLTQSYISKINLGYKFYQPQENYPLRKKKELNHQEIMNYIRNNSTKTNKQLSDELNVSLSTIKRDKIKMKS